MASKSTAETTPTIAEQLEALLETMDVEVRDQFLDADWLRILADSDVMGPVKEQSSPLIQEELTDSSLPAKDDDQNLTVEKSQKKEELEAPLKRNGRGSKPKELSFLYTIVRLAMKYGRPKDKQKLGEQLAKLDLKGFYFDKKAAFVPYYAGFHQKTELGFQRVHKRFLKRITWKPKYQNDQFMEISYICSIFIGLPDRNALFELLLNKQCKQFEDAQACLENLRHFSTMVKYAWDFAEEQPVWRVKWLVKESRTRCRK